MPAIIFTDTYVWNDATVTVTIDDDAPGYSGLYHWNYHVQNNSFASGISAFALPAEDSGMVSNLGNSRGWTGSVGTFMGNVDLIAWQGSSPPVSPPPPPGPGPNPVPNPVPVPSATIGIGQSGDFWFTTTPVDIALTNGIISDAGLTTTIGGLLLVPTALPAPPQPQPNKLLVATEKDGDLNNKLTTLRDATATANMAQPGQQQRIRFTNGMQGKTITLNDTLGTLDLEKNIVVDGLGKNITLTRDTTKPDFRLFHVWDTAKITSFIGLTLKNGRATTEGQSKGGAIYAQGESLTLQDCTFTENKANSGGAVALITGTLDVVNCTFDNNEAVTDDGGGIFIGSAVTVANISNSYIINNTAAHDGGGIMLWGITSNTSLTINASVIAGNSAQSKGAGICIDSDTNNPQLTLTGGTWIASNILSGANSKGGGLYLGKGSATLDGVTFAYNAATFGDGLYAATGTQGFVGPGGVDYIDDDYFEEE